MNREIAIIEKLEKDVNLKQLQIRSLLTITQAINDNVSQDGLFSMYHSFLSWEMGIEKMALFVAEDEDWHCRTVINYEYKENGLVQKLLNYKRLHTVKPEDDELLQDFDIIIPVFHKDHPIAYSVIGGIKDKDDLYNKIQFITTITNIIAVAIENKRLFNRQIEQMKYKRELELAQEVQSMLIPDELPSSDKFSLSKIYMPHYNIGGDYLDYIKYNEDRFAICIADISGKGVAAALLMANFQATIQNLIFQYRDLETFIFALNQAVYKITKSDKYITFFVAEIDVTAKTLRYVNAGHFPPLLVNKNGDIRKLDSGCTVIGAFDRLPEIKEEIIELDGESTLLCFTDGLAELKNTKEEYFEEHALQDFLRTHADKTPDELNARLLEVIESYSPDQEYLDDIAVLTCKVY